MTIANSTSNPDLSLGLICEFPDPHDLGVIPQALCELAELHVNLALGAVIAVFRVWRSQAAKQNGKPAIHTFNVTLAPEDAGRDLCQMASFREFALTALEQCRAVYPAFVANEVAQVKK